MSSTADLVRAIAVALTAVAQVVASPLTLAIGPTFNTGAISDANQNPITPAGYAFGIWGLIYLGCLALAVYQFLPPQRGREVHRRTGWWLTGAFAASAVWVPLFGSQLIWVSEIVIIVLVGLLAVACWRATLSGPAETTVERVLLRLPVTVYLGWATLAAAAGFATMLRSLGMAAQGRGVTAICLVLVVAATAVSVTAIHWLSAAAGFTFTAAWALVAVAIGTDEGLVRLVTLLALAIVVGALVTRTSRSHDRRTVLLG